ncbi:uncharacterized protein IL334_007252 [Kwoniella shivajii]|uniref:Transmembrane protein n=1 Tax=Kwoniella shivajii TaxID=564305 RepID=A0ABZ1DC49_9TREE|nr:hypothetical protein IL334_007252 [Kwoniella shivajii]
MEVIIDNASPQISYYSNSNGWIVNHSTNQKYGDPNTNRYSQSTFHATFTEGDRMEFRFNGSGIAVHGAKRDNHGIFGVQVDNSSIRYLSGHSDVAEYQTELFSLNNLTTHQEHLITVTNYSNDNSTKWWLDIDHLIVTQPVMDNEYTSIIDDSSPFVSYDVGWNTTDPGDSQYYNGTQHISTIPSSVMTLNFSGSSIQLFGSMDTDHGNYSISLDGVIGNMYRATNWQRLTGVSLFFAAGLEEGPHTIQLTNLGKSNITTMDFDYAVVNSTVNATTTGGDSSSIPNDTGEVVPPPNKSHSGAIAGTVIAILLVFILLFAAAFFVYRRRQGRSISPRDPDNPTKGISSRAINQMTIVPKRTSDSKQDWTRLPDPPETAGSVVSFDASLPSSTRNSGSRRDTVIPSLPSFRASFPSLFQITPRSSQVPTVRSSHRESNPGSRSIISRLQSFNPPQSYQNKNHYPFKTGGNGNNARSSYQDNNPFKTNTSPFTPTSEHPSPLYQQSIPPYSRSSAHPGRLEYPQQSSAVPSSQALPNSEAMTSPMFSEFFSEDDSDNPRGVYSTSSSNLSHPQPAHRTDQARVSVATPLRHLSVPYTATMVDFDSSAYTTTTSIYSSRRGTGISEEIDLGLFSIPEFAPPAYAQATRISLGPGKLEILTRSSKESEV